MRECEEKCKGRTTTEESEAGAKAAWAEQRGALAKKEESEHQGEAKMRGNKYEREERGAKSEGGDLNDEQV